MTKRILDACCGARSFWFNKTNPDVLFADCRDEELKLCDDRIVAIHPDDLVDFRCLPYPAESFYLVVFDPPHLVSAGEHSWLKAKYGVLPSHWQEYIRQGVSECMRVLKPNGVLIFKWCEEQIKLSEILACIDYEPLFGDQRSKTHWMCFMKGGE